uniref:ARAD1D18172p n=1 Tax=Blastobotrys adeninivorans TaxID=409370 RepID=A0A060TFX4_BLAAD
MDLDIRRHRGDIPYSLLLLADETVEAIDKYIFKCQIFLAFDHDQPVGVFAVEGIDGQEELELKNIAVDERYRNQGVGKHMMQFVKQLGIEGGYKRLTVGTSDTGYDQLRFYENNGFKRTGVRANFFLDNYPEPIFENGEQMRDMIMLSYSLHQ